MNHKVLITLVAMAATANLSPVTVHAFVAPSQQSRAKIVSPITPSLALPSSSSSIPENHSGRRTTTSLKMGYQLPPSGGGGGPKGPFEQIEAILPTIVTGVLVALFFASPLGGIFFAITNSLFVLALITPLILYVGFQIWSALYFVEAPCPSCGRLPVRALKSGEPSVCISCGAFSRVTEKGDGLELCNNPNDVNNMGGSLFDSLFGMGGNGMSDFADITGGPQQEGGTGREEEAKKAKRQGTIIDVDVERE
eukprot:CAMPEP_0181108138 /NCGR_PEP_ID=MMETSP1071-20121207/17470_1 /TAXON_ID=35127 /ORGANISM="Thalassiosira sp., Strain NH16" /LENGTH=251 /DNA_ID=CAMNT_0023191721 /DNA_START=127 /DNA_END=882 /DNA_ORIENTATION=+